MRPLNTATAKILDALTAGLQPGEARIIDNSDGTYMPTHVNALGGSRFSVTHYYTQNGDLVPDPDGEFYRTAHGTWFPVALQHCTGHYTRAIEFKGTAMHSFRRRAYAELRSFATAWMRNIREQQGGIKKLAA